MISIYLYIDDTKLLNYFFIKRRGWDSNPRMLSHRWFSRPEPSTTRPPLQLLTDIKVQLTNFTSTSLLLIEEFRSREMTINLILYIVGYHYNFVQVFGTNFIIHNTHLIGTTTELNFTVTRQFCFAFFASDSDHGSCSSLVECPKTGSNRRPPRCKRDALPLSYSGLVI